MPAPADATQACGKDTVFSALLICLVVVCLFLTGFVSRDIGTLISGLFILAMAFLIVSLVFLLFEVGVSTNKLRQGLEYVVAGESRPAQK